MRVGSAIEYQGFMEEREGGNRRIDPDAFLGQARPWPLEAAQ